MVVLRVYAIKELSVIGLDFFVARSGPGGMTGSADTSPCDNNERRK